MIRPLRLRPRQVKSLRNWTIEFAIVVAGVLLALWVAELASDRREMRDVAMAEKAVREEILWNLTGIEAWDASTGCYLDQTDIFIGRLREDGRAWEGMNRTSATDGGETSDGFRAFQFSLFEMRFAAWQSAQDNGWAARFDPELNENYRDLHFLFEDVAERIESFVAAEAALRPYGYAAALTQVETRQAIGELLTIKNASVRMGILADWAREARASLEYSEAELAYFAELIDGWAVIATRWEPLRACYTPPDRDLKAAQP